MNPWWRAGARFGPSHHEITGPHSSCKLFPANNQMEKLQEEQKKKKPLMEETPPQITRTLQGSSMRSNSQDLLTGPFFLEPSWNPCSCFHLAHSSQAAARAMLLLLSLWRLHHLDRAPREKLSISTLKTLEEEYTSKTRVSFHFLQ